VMPGSARLTSAHQAETPVDPAGRLAARSNPLARRVTGSLAIVMAGRRRSRGKAGGGVAAGRRSAALHAPFRVAGGACSLTARRVGGQPIVVVYRHLPSPHLDGPARIRPPGVRYTGAI
jgi:hypothetical protein